MKTNFCKDCAYQDDIFGCQEYEYRDQGCSRILEFYGSYKKMEEKLAKEFTAKTGRQTKSFDKIKMPDSQRALLDWVFEELEKSKIQIQDLKQQLTWRDVSEKPKEHDMYVVIRVFQGYYLTITAEYSCEFGTWFYEGQNITASVIKWLPIPNEGE